VQLNRAHEVTREALIRVKRSRLGIALRLLVPILTLFAVFLLVSGAYKNEAVIVVGGDAEAAGRADCAAPSSVPPASQPAPSSSSLSFEQMEEVARLRREVEELVATLKEVREGVDTAGRRAEEVAGGVDEVRGAQGAAAARLDAQERGIAGIEAEVGAVRAMAREAMESARRIREEALEAVKEEVARAVPGPASKPLAKNLALLAAGARVVASHTTESIAFSRYYLPLWTRSFLSPRENRPELALSALGEDQLAPGQCFGFRGQSGRLAVKLAWSSAIHRVVVAHTRAAKDLTSAPREITVMGFPEGAQPGTVGEGVQLCTVAYDIEGPAAQEWRCEGGGDRVFESVIVQVASNNGNSEFTCLYSVKLFQD
jgi:hypothetical protein